MIVVFPDHTHLLFLYVNGFFRTNVFMKMGGISYSCGVYMATIAYSIETGLLLLLILVQIYNILSSRIRPDQRLDGIQVNENRFYNVMQK